MKITTIETAGFAAAIQALHLPYNGECKSINSVKQNELKLYKDTGLVSSSIFFLSEHDRKLILALRKHGDEHAKVLRGIIAWLEITAPIYFWCEMETYVVGHQRLCSASTMHTECKGLSGDELQKAKAEIPMGREITKIDYFSYQTLSRIYSQRKTHRLQEWKDFCKHLETLPFFEDFIKPLD